jgi:hypothetical protein
MGELHPITIAIGAGNFTLLLGVLVFLNRMDRRITVWMIEHEMLISDYAERKGLRIDDLPTRTRSH